MKTSPKPPAMPLDYATPTARRPLVRRAYFWVLLGITGAAVSGKFLLPTQCTYPSPVVNRVFCASNLRQIGQAMMLYANENKGHYPDTFDELLATQDISAAVFICPDSNDSPAGGSTTQSVANLHAGGHLSYIYLAKGMTSPQKPDVVIAYEPLSNHHNTGMNVLFGDLHVDWLNAKDAAWMLSELKLSHNPPTTQPVAPAK